METTEHRHRTLEERLAAIRNAKSDTPPPSDALAVIDRFIERQRVEIMPKAARAGSTFPPFTAKDSTGATVSSSALLAKGPLVVSLFRGSWCPYCTQELMALNEHVKEFAALGASLVVVSPEKAQRAEANRKARHLEFPIVTDDGLSIAKSVGLAYEMPDDVRAVYEGRFKIDLAAWNADGAWHLPIPGRIVVRPNGTIADVAADPDYSHRPEPTATLEVLRKL
jgi:peroxiredoxin